MGACTRVSLACPPRATDSPKRRRLLHSAAGVLGHLQRLRDVSGRKIARVRSRVERGSISSVQGAWAAQTHGAGALNRLSEESK